MYVDPTGHWFWAAIGVIIGAVSGGISAHRNNQPIWQGVLTGGLQGFLSGAALGTPFSSITEQGHWWGLMRASGGFGLGGQVAGAAGAEDVQKYFNYASMGTAGLYFGGNILKGVKDWAHENRFGLHRKDGAGSFVQSGEHVHVNGVLTDLETVGGRMGALDQAWERGADVLAYNPTSGPIADLTESLLQKVTFTSSISRQLSNSLVGLNNIALSGFSQGGIIASNVMLNLGFRNQRSVVGSLTVKSTQVSQFRVMVSGAVGGGLSFSEGTLIYGTGSAWDFSNALGPNLMPDKFLGGVAGLSFPPLGISKHRWPKQ